MKNKEFKIKTLIQHENVDVMVNNNILEIKVMSTNSLVNFDLSELLKKPKRIFSDREAADFLDKNIIALYKIGKIAICLYLSNNEIWIAQNNVMQATGYSAKLRIFATLKNTYFFGKFTHRARNAFMQYDYLYLGNNKKPIAKFWRPFSKVIFLKKIGFFRVSFEKMAVIGKVNQRFYVGNNERALHQLALFFPNEQTTRGKKQVKSKLLKKMGKELLVLRTTENGNLIRTVVQHTPEYTLIHRIKICFAHILSKPHLNKKNVNLYFEKQSTTAAESAFRVFEHVMEENHDNDNSINYFILDKNAKNYQYMKNKYQNRILSKYSFKHYFYVFKADYFISSELSKHVINDRIFIPSLQTKIATVPLIFLQHGITFAKPVESLPFHKSYSNSVYKNVIGSKLEAQEFYKMGYKDEDLILTGMATFDFAKLDENAEKITYMPTYRRWEQRLIYTNKIEETSYYRSIMRVIKAFEEKGLVDQLLICPHNKFSEFIYQNMPQYRHIIAQNPSEALKISKIFITDFSSAIYDAQYRGAYPIFYWEEKDFLIDKWKSVPPVNEENAPGPIAMNVDELINIVNQAIANNYIVEDEYQQKYLKINEFNENKNTERIVKFLKSDGIL